MQGKRLQAHKDVGRAAEEYPPLEEPSGSTRPPRKRGMNEA